jgi:hypothetical protein
MPQGPRTGTERTLEEARGRHAQWRGRGGARALVPALLPDHPDSAPQNLSMSGWDDLMCGLDDVRFS